MPVDIILDSWNVRGIQDKAKKSLLFHMIFKSQANICFIQETHISRIDWNKELKKNGSKRL